MRHRVKKMKFSKGKDANEMLLKKLLSNFLIQGKITTTQKKAKAVKSGIDRIVSKSKNRTQSNKNYLLSHLTQQNLIPVLFDQIAPIVKTRVGGYTRIIKLGVRDSDGAEMARVEWVDRVVLNQEKKKKEKKTQNIKKDKSVDNKNKAEKEKK